MKKLIEILPPKMVDRVTGETWDATPEDIKRVQDQALQMFVRIAIQQIKRGV